MTIDITRGGRDPAMEAWSYTGDGEWECDLTWTTQRYVSLTEVIVDWTHEQPLFTVGRVGVNSVVDYGTAREPFTAERLNRFLPKRVFPGQHVAVRVKGKGPTTVKAIFVDDVSACRRCGALPGRCQSAYCECTCATILERANDPNAPRFRSGS